MVSADPGARGSDENSHAGGPAVHRSVSQRLECDPGVADPGDGAGPGGVHAVLPESHPGTHHGRIQIARREGGACGWRLSERASWEESTPRPGAIPARALPLLSARRGQAAVPSPAQSAGALSRISTPCLPDAVWG